MQKIGRILHDSTTTYMYTRHGNTDSILSEIYVIAAAEGESWWSDDAIKRVITTCPDVQQTDYEKRCIACTWNTKVLPMFC